MFSPEAQAAGDSFPLGFYLHKGKSTPAYESFRIIASLFTGEQRIETVMSDVPFDTYYGFIAPEGIMSVSLMDLPGDGCMTNWSFDNVSHGAFFENNTSNPVPEPGSLFLFGTGLIGLASIGRRMSEKVRIGV